VRIAIRAAAAIAATALLAAGCSRAGTSATQASSSTPATSSSAAPSAPASPSAPSGVSFGTVTDVCHGGNATGAPDQGVTSSEIKAGVLTDVGFTKDPELETTAKVFTDWCNAAGGIGGRKLVADIHDTQLLDVVGAVAEACASDFVLAGGSAALDGLAVNTRLKCLLPDFDAQVVMPQNNGASIQIYPIPWSNTYSVYGGYYQWLTTEYPASKNAVGILSGASVITQVDSDLVAQTVKGVGGTVVYNGTFPISGVTNWTPYAETLKNHGVKGFTFYGEDEQLTALETAMDNIGYKPDWIDANTNAYGNDFLTLAGKTVLADQHNYADLPGVYPVEKAADNPATDEVVKLFAQYAPGQPVTLQDLQAWSAWLIFAKSAESCGSALTRVCVYDAALKQTDWTGGGLTAAKNVADPSAVPSCYNIEQATAAGWVPAPFDPNNGAYRCGMPAIKITGIPGPTTLASLGLSLSALK
jgi:hypothetical protein